MKQQLNGSCGKAIKPPREKRQFKRLGEINGDKLLNGFLRSMSRGWPKSHAGWFITRCEGWPF
jgi:hypothetical protein